MAFRDRNASLFKTSVAGVGYSAEIQIHGLRETLEALKAFEPEVHKALRKSMKEAVRPIASMAAGRSGGTYGTQVRASGRPLVSVFAKVGPMANKNDWSSPATKAVIMEFAQKAVYKQGPKTGQPYPQGESLIGNYDAFGKPGRFLWDAWDSGAGAQAMADIERSVTEAERELQAMLDAAGGDL